LPARDHLFGIVDRSSIHHHNLEARRRSPTMLSRVAPINLPKLYVGMQMKRQDQIATSCFSRRTSP
jgi:hypothetical protein